MVTPRGQTGPLPTTGAATGAGALPFSLLLALVEAIEARAPFVRGSARDVALYAVMAARALGLAGGEIGAVRLAALLRDIGMLNVPEAILHK